MTPAYAFAFSLAINVFSFIGANNVPIDRPQETTMPSVTIGNEMDVQGSPYVPLTAVLTSKGICRTDCKYHNQSSPTRTCDTLRGSAECSLHRESVDGRRCRNDSPCSYGFVSYLWCYLRDGGWGTCSLTLNTAEEDVLRLTTNGYCFDACSKTKGSMSLPFSWCNGGDSLGETPPRMQYCSIRDGYTSNGNKCSEGHSCGYHGESYSWCYVDSIGDWDYCSINLPLKRKHTHHHRSTGNDQMTLIPRDNTQLQLEGVQGGYCYPGKILAASMESISLSHVLQSTLNFTCGTGMTVPYVTIIGLKEVVIDSDFNRIGNQLQQLSIISEIWTVVGNVTIELSGKDGEERTFVAGNGVGYGENGANGLPGNDGGNGATFLGIGNEIAKAQGLTIVSNGGDGGNGQNGGNGTDGRDGTPIEYSLIAHPSNLSCINFDVSQPNLVFKLLGDALPLIYKQWKEESVWFQMIAPKLMTALSFSVEGEEGQEGGDAGQGGKFGSGGKQGSIILSSNLRTTSDIRILSNDGKQGRSGRSGHPGNGGRNSNILRLGWVEFEKVGWVLQKMEFPFANLGWILEKEVRSNGTASPGEFGGNGTIEYEAASQTSPELHNVLQPLVDLKEFVTTSTPISQQPSNQVLRFLDVIDSDEVINDNLSPQILLEEVRFVVKNFQRFPPPWLQNQLETLSHKTDIRLQNMQGSGTNEEDLLCLDYIKRAVLSQLILLKEATLPYLIIDISRLLESTSSSIQQYAGRATTIAALDKLQRESERHLLSEIVEAQNLVAHHIIPRLEGAEGKLRLQVERLKIEVSTLLQESEDRRKEIGEKVAEAEKASVIRRVLSVFHVIRIVASILSPPLGILLGSPVPFTVTSDIGATSIAATIDERLDGLIQRLEAIGEQLQQNPIVERSLAAFVDQKIRHLSGIRSEENLRTKAATANDIIEFVDSRLRQSSRDYRQQNETNASVFLQRGLLLLHGGVEVSHSFSSNKEIVNTGAIFRKFSKLERNVTSSLLPFLDAFNVQGANKSTGANSISALQISKLDLQTSLHNLRTDIKAFDKFEAGKTVSATVREMDDVLLTWIRIHERMSVLKNEKQLFQLITNAHKAATTGADIPVIDNCSHSGMVAELDSVVQQAILMTEYEKAINSFKQWVFPFAKNYLDKMSEPSNVTQAASNLATIKTKLDLYKRSIIPQADNLLHEGPFFQSASSSPFCTWEDNDDTIKTLLQGDKVLFNADIKTCGHPVRDAVKFKALGLEFSPKSPVLEEHLRGFKAVMKHAGNSYYKIGDDVYAISTGPLEISFSFEKNNATNVPLHVNSVYKKLREGDLMLSPYATWSIQLISMKPSSHSFDRLQEIAAGMELKLDLIGFGSYVETATGDYDFELQKYYSAENDGTLLGDK